MKQDPFNGPKLFMTENDETATRSSSSFCMSCNLLPPTVVGSYVGEIEGLFVGMFVGGL